MTTYHAPDEYTGSVLYVKNPTIDLMTDAVWALPEDLRLEYWFEYKPRPKSKRIYLTEKEEFREAMQKWGTAGASAGTIFCKKYDFMFEGFLPGRFQRPGFSFSYGFNSHHDLDKKVEEGRQYALRAFEHFARFFDTYHAVASPIRALEAQKDARKAVFFRKATVRAV